MQTTGSLASQRWIVPRPHSREQDLQPKIGSYAGTEAIVPRPKTIFLLQRIERWGFDPELLYLAKKFKLRVSEVPVAWAHREGTRINPIRDGTKMFVELLKIRWKGGYLVENISSTEGSRVAREYIESGDLRESSLYISLNRKTASAVCI